jgi:pimeloyl-ACP methyl ester carboxylesterase
VSATPAKDSGPAEQTHPSEADEELAQLRLATELAGIDVDEVVAPADRHAVVDGMRLHYLDWGNPRGRPLLFLHGGRLNAHTWDPVCLALRAQCHCLALDLRGHGDSEWSPGIDYRIESHVQDLDGLIVQLGLRAPVLIGQSLGGLVALTLASRVARRIAGVVAVDVSPQVNPRGTGRITSFVADPGPGTVEEFVSRALAASPNRHPELLRHSLRHNLRQLPEGGYTWKYDHRRLAPEYVEIVFGGLRALSELTDEIACPVLVARGGESDVLDEAEAARFAAALPHGSWTQVAGAGHNVQSDNPGGLAEAIRGFLVEIGADP